MDDTALYPFGTSVHGEVLAALDLYVPDAQAVHVTPLSALLYPALHVPAELPPQPLLLASHTEQNALPAAVLYIPAEQAMHVTPLL